MDLQLHGKTAIVTGGGSGLGKHIALALAEEGADVVIASRDRSRLGRVAHQIADATGRRVIPIAYDITDRRLVAAMVDAAARELGRIDILVNNGAPAGGGGGLPLAHTTDELVLENLDVKSVGYLRCIRAVAPHMLRQRFGRIVNIAGMAARYSGAIAGGMRNAAVVVMAKNVADQLGPHGIAVTTVHPGGIWTDESSDWIENDRRGTRLSSYGEGDENAIRRAITPRDLANVVLFLCSPHAAAVTGEAISVAGGGEY